MIEPKQDLVVSSAWANPTVVNNTFIDFTITIRNDGLLLLKCVMPHVFPNFTKFSANMAVPDGVVLTGSRSWVWTADLPALSTVNLRARLLVNNTIREYEHHILVPPTTLVDTINLGDLRAQSVAGTFVDYRRTVNSQITIV